MRNIEFDCSTKPGNLCLYKVQILINKEKVIGFVVLVTYTKTKWYLIIVPRTGESVDNKEDG